MNERRWERFGAEAGIAFVVLGMVAIFVQGDIPGQNASGQELTTWLSDNRDGQLLSYVLWSVASVFGLFFVATLRARLSEAEGGHNELATAAAIGGLFIFAANWAGGLMVSALAFRNDPDVAPSLVRIAVDMSNLAMVAANIGVVVVAVSIAAVVLSAGLLPKWVGYFSCGVAGVCAVALFGLFADSGAMAPGGAYQMVASLAGVVLPLTMAIEFLRHEAPVQAGRTAAMPA